MIIVHVTQCSFTKAKRRLEDPSAHVSAHLAVRSSDGFIAHSVSEIDIAWHAGNWGQNRRSIGIEHKGYVDKPAYLTEAMYRSSARSAVYLCDKYHIPVDRGHIIGQSEVPHTVSYFDWHKYFLYIRACLDH